MPRARDARGRFVKGKAKVKAKKAVKAVKKGKRTWITALRAWNTNRDEWTIPKRNTKEYRQVRKLMGE